MRFWVLKSDDIPNDCPKETNQAIVIKAASESFALDKQNDCPVNNRERKEVVVTESSKKITVEQLVKSTLSPAYRALQTRKFI